MAKPLNFQRFEKALDLKPFMKFAETVLSKNDDIQSEESDDENGTYHDKELLFNVDDISEDRKWLINLLMSDTESDSEISDDVDKYVNEMLKEYKQEKKIRMDYHQTPSVSNKC